MAYTARYMRNEVASIMDASVTRKARAWYRRETAFKTLAEAQAWAEEAAWNPALKDIRITRDVEREVVPEEPLPLGWGRKSHGYLHSTEGGLAYGTYRRR